MTTGPRVLHVLQSFIVAAGQDLAGACALTWNRPTGPGGSSHMLLQVDSDDEVRVLAEQLGVAVLRRELIKEDSVHEWIEASVRSGDLELDIMGPHSKRPRSMLVEAAVH